MAFTNCCDNWHGQTWRSTTLSPNLCLQQCLCTCRRTICQLINSNVCPSVQPWEINNVENARRIMLAHEGGGYCAAFKQVNSRNRICIYETCSWFPNCVYLAKKPFDTFESIVLSGSASTNCCDNWFGQMWRPTTLSPKLCVSNSACVHASGNIFQLIDFNGCPNVQAVGNNKLGNAKCIMLTHKGVCVCGGGCCLTLKQINSRNRMLHIWYMILVSSGVYCNTPLTPSNPLSCRAWPPPIVATIGLGKCDDTQPCLQSCAFNNACAHASATIFNYSIPIIVQMSNRGK